MTETAFSIGSLDVRWYGIMIVTGILAALAVAWIEARRHGEDPDHLPGLALLAVILGTIGARLYHVVDRLDYFIQHPAEIVGGQGLGIFGAIIGGALGLFIYTRWKKLSTLRWLDILAPGLVLAQAIGRWGNYFNQELYGYPTDLPWGIYIAPENRLAGYEAYTHFQPLFFYESMWNLLGFGLLMFLGRKLHNRLKKGDIFLMYIIHYGIGRIILEGMKIDVWTIGGLPTASWISGLGILIAGGILIKRHQLLRHGEKHEAPDL